jgi:hypothetical protein
MLIALSFLLLIATFYVMLPCGSILFAQSGCCKRRDSLRAPWYRVSLSFDQCKQVNDKTDRDNVFDQGGLVWWDSSCR